MPTLTLLRLFRVAASLLLCFLTSLLTAWLTVHSAAGADAAPRFTDVFLAGQEGYHTYRIPALVVGNKGTLLAFCEGRKTGRNDHGDVDLVLKRSTDGGKTWSRLQLVYEEGGDQKITIGNACPVVDRETGTIWLPFTRDNNDVFVTSSDDEGQTWARPKQITADVKHADWNWYATGPGNGIQLTRGPHKGRLVIPCDHRVKNKGDWNQAGRSHVFYSDDHGRSWKLGGITDWGMNECAVVELNSGALLLNMRSYRGKGCRGVATSRDGGLTWSETVDAPALIESVCQASLVRCASPDPELGSWLVFSNPATTTGRHHLTVRISLDDGQTWPITRLIYEGSAAYSSLTSLPGGESGGKGSGWVGLLFERDDYGKITFTEFPSSAESTKELKSPAAGKIPDYQPVVGWPQLPATITLGAVSGVATDSADRVYVLQRAEPPVLVFDRSGAFVRSWGEGLLKAPHGLRIDRTGHIWVTDTVRHIAIKFDAAGKRLLTLGTPDQPGDGTDQFNKPTDVAVGPGGEIYVTDGYGNARVMKFTPEGKFLKQWGKKGTGKGEFNLPHSICMDGKGRLYVGDRENNRVQVFDGDGQFLAVLKESGAPYGLFLKNDRLYVADGRAQWIMVLDLQGKPLGRLSMGEGAANAPHWVCLDSQGALYVAYVGGKRVQKFEPK